MFLSLAPAPKRDYKKPEEVQKDWDNNLDFQICDISSRYDGMLINKQDAPVGNTMKIRYKSRTKVHLIEVK
jgi:hypothetical protein